MKKIISLFCAAALSLGVLAGCSNSSGNEGAGKEVFPSGKLSEIHQAVKEAYGDAYYPNNMLTDDMLQEKYGLKKEMYKEAIADVPMIYVNIDTFLGIEAEEGKAEEVEAALKAYRDDQIENGMNYPMNIPKVQGAEVLRKGNYVFFLMLGTIPQDIMDGEDEEAKVKAAKEQNQIAVDAINTILK